MGRTRIRYARPDATGSAVANVAASMRSLGQQRPVSGYAGARFAEWEQNAPEREALLQARLAKAQSDAELAGAQFRYNFWKDQELRRQTTAYYTAMPMLQEQLKQNGIYPGSQRYAAEMASFAAELPDAVTHNTAIRDDLKKYAAVDEDAARIQKMMADQGISKTQAQIQAKTAALPQNFRPTSIDVTAAGDVNVRSGLEKIEQDLTKQHGIGRTQFETLTDAFRGQLDDSGKFTPTEGGNDIQFRVIKDGKPSKVSMSVPEFNAYKQAFGQEPISEQATQGTPTPTPSNTPDPRMQLAQRALNDPNATEDHKAAARKILGIEETNGQ